MVDIPEHIAPLPGDFFKDLHRPGIGVEYPGDDALPPYRHLLARVKM